jgi:inorganic pyrophosphatase
VALGDRAPHVVTAFIEIVPTDTVKYELDKVTGLLRVDRPQKYSNVCPAPYGLLPRTICGPRVAARAVERVGKAGIVGDDDPLDVCVLTERSIAHGNVLMQAIPVGGFRMLDRDEADDKILAVLEGDPVFGSAKDVGDLPSALVDRLRHYFLTYKQPPGDSHAACSIAEVYGRLEAIETIERSRADYRERYGDLEAGTPPTVQGP